MSVFRSFWVLGLQDGFLKIVCESCRWYFVKYFTKYKYVVRNIHGSKMRLDLSDNGISRGLGIVGSREEEHRYMLVNEVKPNYNIVDVGANIGYYVLLEKTLLKTGKILCFEPVPKNFGVLERNIELNGYNNILALNNAVSNKDQELKIHLSKLSNVHTALPNDVLNQMSGDVITVDAISIVSVLKNAGVPIHLIRMDVEGYEVEILENLVEAVQNGSCKPSVLFELHPRKYSASHCLKTQLEKLLELGYKFKYMASSNKQYFDELKLEPVESLKTDGKIRYVYKNVTGKKALLLFSKCRTILLKGGK